MSEKKISNKEIKEALELMELIQHNKSNLFTIKMMGIKKGADAVNYVDGETKETPLSLAIKYNYDKMAQKLVGKGANVNHMGLDGKTPLILALKNYNMAMVSFLIENGAHHFYRLNDKGFMELSDFTRRNQEIFPRYQEVFKVISDGKNKDLKNLLHEKPFLINGINKKLEKPIHYAVRKGNFDAVKILVENGAKILDYNEKFESPLDIAYNRGSDEIFKYLKVHSPANNEQVMFEMTTKKAEADKQLGKTESMYWDKSIFHLPKWKEKSKSMQVIDLSDINLGDPPNSFVESCTYSSFNSSGRIGGEKK